MAPARIGLVLDSPIIGGAERSALNLVASYRGGSELVIIAPYAETLEDARRIAPGHKCVLVDQPCGWREHRRAFRALRLDLVQLTLANPFVARPATVAAASLRIPVVVVEQLVRPARRRRGRMLKRLISLVVDRHVAVGSATADELHRYFGIPRRRIDVIYNGIADEPQRPHPFDHHPIIGCAARLEDQKQLEVLIEALALLPHVHLLLVGDGTRREALTAQSVSLGVADRVHITGWVDDARPWIAGLDVFVLPSREEAFPLSIVEAMLSGVPVIASDVGSVREAVRDGDTGLLVRSGSVDDLVAAVTAVLDDPAHAQRMAHRGRTLAQAEFTADAMAARYDELWTRLLSGRERPLSGTAE